MSTALRHRNLIFLALLLATLTFFLPVARADDAVRQKPTIVFMTDFGVVDDSVARCKGVM